MSVVRVGRALSTGDARDDQWAIRKKPSDMITRSDTGEGETGLPMSQCRCRRRRKERDEIGKKGKEGNESESGQPIVNVGGSLPRWRCLHGRGWG